MEFQRLRRQPGVNVASDSQLDLTVPTVSLCSPFRAQIERMEDSRMVCIYQTPYLSDFQEQPREVGGSELRELGLKVLICGMGPDSVTNTADGLEASVSRSLACCSG